VRGVVQDSLNGPDEQDEAAMPMNKATAGAMAC
jgi:hypothetical protein